jgi:hypothetical protein
MRVRIVASLAVVVGALEARSQGAGRPRVVDDATIDPRQGLTFAASVWPRTVYVGQQATYEIGIFLGDELRARLRSNPQFVPPDVPSTLTIDLAAPPGPLHRSAHGQTYDVHVFARALFPLTPGTHQVAPARLTYALPLGTSFFSREESHSVRSQALTFTAREPPVAGRPADFGGAVGQLALRSWSDTRRTRVGDPIVLTVAVDGVGNVSLFPRPSVAVVWGQAVDGGERVRLDSSAYLVTGSKEFDYVITPERSGGLALPEVRYPFFNPYSERYEIAVAPSLSVQVAPAALVGRTLGSDGGTPPLALRRVFRGEVPPAVTERAWFWLVAALAPVPAVALGTRRGRRMRRESTRRLTNPLERVAQGSDASALRRALGDALMARAAIPSGVLGDPPRLERQLRRAGVSAEGARGVGRVARELNEAAFAPGGVLAPDLAVRATDAFAQVDREAKPRGGAKRRGAWLAPLLLVGPAVAAAAFQRGSSPAGEQFAAGVNAYDAGDVGEAIGHFRGAAALTPRAADAWANLGTAGWRAGDTAAAVIGWQRALRLEPTAIDMRGRLGATPGFRDGLLGEIPPVPVTALGWLGMISWLAGWALLVRPARRRLAVATVVFGALALVAATGARQRHAGEDRVVVVLPERLRTVPALGVDVGPASGSSTGAGETAARLSEEGAWTRLRFADGREGWLETRRLESLAIR